MHPNGKRSPAVSCWISTPPSFAQVKSARFSHREQSHQTMSILWCGRNSHAATFSTFRVCSSGFVRTGSTIARSSHQAALPPQLKSAADKIRAELAKKPFDPPNHKDLAQDGHSQQALKFLIEQGEIIQISEEIALSRDSVE